MAIAFNEILIPKKLFSYNPEKELEFDTSLPDYCPDIARLIKVDCTPFVENCVIEKDKAIISGKAVYDVLYETDYKSRLRCCNFTQEFNFNFPIQKTEAENISAFSKCDCQKISCKLLSPRRLIIKSLLGVSLTAEGETPTKAIAVQESKDIFFKKKTIGFEGKTNQYSESFQFSEILPLAQREKNIGEIVCGYVTLQKPQINLSPAHAEIKTVADLHILCEEENNEGEYYFSSKSLPLNIDYKNEAIEDFKTANVILETVESQFTPELDQYGESRNVKASFEVKMKLRLNEPKAFTVAEDMFEKDFDSIPVKTQSKILRRLENHETNFSADSKIQSLSPKPEIILDSNSKLFNSKYEMAEDGIKLSGSFITTLMTDTTEGIYSMDHSVPFEHLIPKTDYPQSNNVSVEVYPLETNSTLHSDGSVSIRIIAEAKIDIFEEAEESFISDVTKRTPRPQGEKENCLTYCYPDMEEDLWGIAKIYRVSPEAVSKANPEIFGDNGKIISCDKPILIKN